MEIVLSLGIGVLAGSGIWLILRPRTFQVIIGLSLLSYAVNLFILVMGRLKIAAPPILSVALGRRSGTVHRSSTAGAGTDRDRHQLCDDGAFPCRPARFARFDGHGSCGWTGAWCVSPIVDHLIVLPVVMPLLSGAVMLLRGGEEHRNLNATINMISTLALIGISTALLQAADAAPADLMGVYRIGNWPAPFAIVLVADRLSALMLLLTSLIAAAAVVFSIARWHRVGPHFHALFQFLLMGLNGAFLTGDLFNLFVFFELLLAASYGLALHGSGLTRVSAGLHYIAVNLAASLLFLIGVSLIYSVTGTLNMADLAARIATVRPEDRALFEAGAGILGIAFLLKCRNVATMLLAADDLRGRHAARSVHFCNAHQSGRLHRAAAVAPFIGRGGWSVGALRRRMAVARRDGHDSLRHSRKFGISGHGAARWLFRACLLRD